MFKFLESLTLSRFLADNVFQNVLATLNQLQCFSKEQRQIK